MFKRFLETFGLTTWYFKNFFVSTFLVAYLTLNSEVVNLFWSWAIMPAPPLGFYSLLD